MPDPRPANLPDILNVLLIGGGGREHAIALKLSQSPRLGTLWTTHPENPGIAPLASAVDVPVNIREFYRLAQFCEKNEIHLAVIGPEEPLAEGFADKFSEIGVLAFGPGKDGARLEADKAWAKQLMRGASIPTAEARVFTDAEGARTYIETRFMDDPVMARVLAGASEYRDPVLRRKFIERTIAADREAAAAYTLPRADLPVLKAAGLAKGKGVILPATLAEAITTIDSIMVRRIFGDAGKQLIIEEKLSGPEASVLAVVDGRNILVLPPCQDHKRLLDGDHGPNTGGMGAYCPAAIVDDETLSRVEREVFVPTIDALRREGIIFTGILYAGLMLTHAGPKVLEFNVRFGDPECQPLMARLKSDLLELIVAACTGSLDKIDVQWHDDAACCVVIAAEGYPEKPKLDVPIHGIENAAKIEGVHVFHAGTRRTPEGAIVTAGGRVLGVTGLGPSLSDARARAYAACDLIRFPGRVIRTDIAAKTGR